MHISVCSDSDIRLVGGATAQEGRVEFCNDDTWGTVCDNFWGTLDAIVVCRQLGFPVTEAVAFRNAAFGQGTGPILLDNVACIGSESRLADCSHNGIGINNCGHSEDAGVICQAASPTAPSPTGQLRKLSKGTGVPNFTDITSVISICLCMYTGYQYDFFVYFAISFHVFKT